MRAIVAAFVTLSFAVVIAMLCSSKASAQTCKGVSGQTQSDICYAGGNVLRGATNAYVIYYGSWNSNTQVVINNWLANIGGTGIFGVNTQYPDFTGGAVQNVVNYNGVTNSYQDYQNPGDDYQTLGTQLNGDAAIQTVVSDAISSGHFPADQSGVYFVLTDPNVTQINGPFAGTFCTDYIAYHYASTSIVSGYNIKYALVGNVSQCPHNYDPNIYSGDTTTPNGDVAADGDINLIFHELSEAVTDPWMGSWGATSSQVYEVGDLCEGDFGTWGKLPIGAKWRALQRNDCGHQLPYSEAVPGRSVRYSDCRDLLPWQLRDRKRGIDFLAKPLARRATRHVHRDRVWFSWSYAYRHGDVLFGYGYANNSGEIGGTNYPGNPATLNGGQASFTWTFQMAKNPA